MFTIIKNNTGSEIHLTKGDIANLEVTANTDGGALYVFKVGEIVSFKVFEKMNYSHVMLEKKVMVNEETKSVMIELESDDTKFGEEENKPVDYWYEIKLNPDTRPQTLVGYDRNGPKIFRLYPEGA